MIDIFIDGSANEKTKSYGYAFVVVENKKAIKKQFGKIKNSNINRAELESLYQALLYIDSHEGEYEIYSDCEVVVKSLHGDIKRNGNRDYWALIEPLCEQNVGRFNIFHIPSHRKDESYESKFNNLADRLANKGANSLLIKPILR